MTGAPEGPTGARLPAQSEPEPYPELYAPASDDPLPSRSRSHFLERKTYRRARLEDAARLLPVLGLFLFFGPIAIQSTNAGFGGGTARWLMLFMAVWLILIALAALLARALRRTGRG